MSYTKSQPTFSDKSYTWTSVFLFCTDKQQLRMPTSKHCLSNSVFTAYQTLTVVPVFQSWLYLLISSILCNLFLLIASADCQRGESTCSAVLVTRPWCSRRACFWEKRWVWLFLNNARWIWQMEKGEEDTGRHRENGSYKPHVQHWQWCSDKRCSRMEMSLI